MGALFSCFIRPKLPHTINPTESTPISHPYPLASRSQAMAEYHPSNPGPNRSRSVSRTPGPPLTPTSTSSRGAAAQQGRNRSASMASHHHALRVHEIPFPLLGIDPGSCTSSAPSGSTSITGSAEREGGTGSPMGKMTGLSMSNERGGGTQGRRRLKKVRLVEKDWELWRMDEWAEYGGDNRTGSRRGYVGGERDPI